MNKLATNIKPEMEVVTGPHVYQAIVAVMGELGQEGIAKGRQTEGGGAKFKFRGIDDVYNALAPILAKHNLIILPRILSRDSVERTSNSGGRLCYTTVEAEYQIVSAMDGSSTIARTFGEAMDSGDKSTNKAMAVAYKYMAIQTFCIPTEGDNDPDATVHQVSSEKPAATSAPIADWKALDDEMDACRSVVDLEAWNKRRERDIKGLPKPRYDALGVKYVDLLEKLPPTGSAPPPAKADDFGLSGDNLPEFH